MKLSQLVSPMRKLTLNLFQTIALSRLALICMGINQRQNNSCDTLIDMK